MEVGMAFTRKDYEYKIVAKVPHESREGLFVYMIAQREYGSDEISYFTQEHEFTDGYKFSYWIGV